MNPFTSPLSLLLKKIKPSTDDLERVQQGFEFFENHVSGLSQNHILPASIDKNLIQVGSFLRKTNLSPVKELDLYFILEGSQIKYNSQSRTIEATQAAPSFGEFREDSGYFSSQKCLNFFQKIFSLHFPSAINPDQSCVWIELKSFKLRINFTPAFLYESIFLIPQESSVLSWVKSDPFKELSILKSLDRHHNQLLIPTIQVAKYWNEKKNNSAFRNFHLESIAFLIFGEIPTSIKTLKDSVSVFMTRMPSHLYDCPDPSGLADPVHLYLPDKVDSWYLYMNRVKEAKDALSVSEKSFVEYLIPTQHNPQR